MKIRVRVSSGGRRKGWGRWLRHRAGRLLEQMGMAEAELSLLVAGDRLMRRLNRTWRGRARTTDVLAFSQLEEPGKTGVGRCLMPPSSRRLRAAHLPEGRHRFAEDRPGVLLGDVVLCLPQARRQARELGHPLEKEMLVLLVHGLLHLLGYEHEGVGEDCARRMWRQQQRLVRLLDEE